MRIDMHTNTHNLAAKLTRLAFLTALVMVVGGCVHGQREAFFDARASVVTPREGDGSTRVALWPGRGEPRATASRIDPSRVAEFGR